MPIRGTRVGEGSGSAAGNAWPGDSGIHTHCEDGQEAPGSQSTGQEGQGEGLRPHTTAASKANRDVSRRVELAEGEVIGAGPQSAPLSTPSPPSWPSASLSPSSAQPTPAWVRAEGDTTISGPAGL